MSLRIVVERRPAAIALVRLDGRLDSSTSADLEKALEPVLAGKPSALVFDLAGLTFISSMGLRVLFSARRSMEAHHGKVVTANPRPQIAKVFEIAAALPPEDIFTSVEEADSYLAAMQRKEIEKGGG